jgi:outer membrane protein TolC
MRMTMRTAMAAMVLAVGAASAWAQVSLSSAVDLALRADPRIRSAEADVGKARATLASTRDAYIPNVSANGGYGTSTGVPLSVPVVFSLSSQSLLFNFSQKDNVRAAASGVEAARLALREVQEKVSEDVVVTYLNLSNAEQRQAAAAQEHGFATRLVTIVQERLDSGLESRVELLHAQRTAKQIELQQMQTDDEIAGLSNHLANLIGLSGNTLQAVRGSIPALPPVKTLILNAPPSFGVQAAVADAKSKQELAFGEARYRYRPQVSFGANYARISTSHTDYLDYYPGFHLKSDDAASIGIQLVIPLLDRSHEARAHEAAADALRARFDAEQQGRLFQEGRFKLQHSAAELSAQSDLAEIDRDLAQEQLNAVLLQLSATSAEPGKPQMTPMDEQNARLAERARTIDLLNAQFQLTQLQVNLMRQTGQLEAWLKTSIGAPVTVLPAPTTP